MDEMDPTRYALRIAEGRRHATSGTGRSIRQRANLTLAEVGAVVGVSVVTVHRWEQGERMPRGRNAVKWALFLETLQREALAGQDAA